MKSSTRTSLGKNSVGPRARNIVLGTVAPRKPRNIERRPREYLTAKEVALLERQARRRGRYGHRDATMIVVAYRHGLRVSELCALRWDQIEFDRGLLHVRRMKHGMAAVHPIGGSESRALRRLRREQPDSRYVFLTERRSPMTPAGFRKMLARTGAISDFPFPIHPHMLRHACGWFSRPVSGTEFVLPGCDIPTVLETGSNDRRRGSK